MKTRLEVLAEVLGVPKEQISTRNHHESTGENGNEFIVKEGQEDVYYNVLREDELDARVEELITDCYSEKEIEETYGLTEEGTPNFSTADLETYMELVGEVEGYFIYTSFA